MSDEIPPGVVPFEEWTVKGRWWPTTLRRKQISSAAVIHHSVTNTTGKSSYAQVQEIERVIFDRRIRSRFSMVAYNFLVATDALVFEGRGLKYRNAANNDTKGTGYDNKATLSFCFAGSYEPGTDVPTLQPTPQQLAAVGDVIAWLVMAGHVSKWHEVIPHSYVHRTACPGDNLEAAIPDLARYVSRPSVEEDDDMIIQLVDDPDQQVSMLMWMQDDKPHFDVYSTYRPGAGTEVRGASWVAVDQAAKGNWVQAG